MRRSRLSGIALGTYANKNLGLKGLKNPKNFGNLRFERLEPVGPGYEHDDGNRQGLQVLLELDVLVGSQQRVEVGSGLREKRAVAQPGPTHLNDGANIVTYQ